MTNQKIASAAQRSFDKRGILLRHPIFGQLGEDGVDRLASYAIPKSVKRGVTIFAKGDPGTSLFAICSGTVKISTPSVAGRDAIFNLVGEGQIFGEIALLDGQPRTADASAVSDCELLAIERQRLPTGEA